MQIEVAPAQFGSQDAGNVGAVHCLRADAPMIWTTSAPRSLMSTTTLIVAKTVVPHATPIVAPAGKAGIVRWR